MIHYLVTSRTLQIWLMLIHVPLCEMLDLLEGSHIFLRCIILKADLILVETSSQVFKEIKWS